MFTDGMKSAPASDVTRYRLNDSACGGAAMESWPEGEWDWVRYSDYAALAERCKRLEGALKPFAEYAEKRLAKPFNGLDDVIHLIHVGTEWEAELRFSDCIKARAALSGDAQKGET